MLGFTEVDLKQTRFYQDVHGEGREEEAVILVLRFWALLEMSIGNAGCNNHNV
ncbi:MAG: hypothetical protein GVY04_15400 [Cyanobacteria bacterium]|jgi:hypothetical protein|nr:hypothetical protein [Cyanobacteria bacterium GSL.Bin1]